MTEAFDTAYLSLYKRTTPGVKVEAISWRVVVSGPSPEPSLRRGSSELAETVGTPTGTDREGDASTKAAIKGARDAYFPETGFQPTPVYDRYALLPGQRFQGPAIVEERESTVIVGPDAWVEVDRQLSLAIKLPDAATGSANDG